MNRKSSKQDVIRNSYFLTPVISKKSSPSGSQACSPVRSLSSSKGSSLLKLTGNKEQQKGKGSLLKKVGKNKRVPHSRLQLSEKNIKKQLLRPKLKFLRAVGHGGFGKVWKVELEPQGIFFALKEMPKALVIKKKSVQSVMNERLILERLHSNFIVNAVCSYQTRQFLYLIIEYMEGGDLRYYINMRRSFSQSEVKFIVSCIVLGLQELRLNRIIHRDIKPQNLVFNKEGYLKITDFGVARQQTAINYTDTSGTPGYMSPEVIFHQNHSYEADYFALGVIVYQLIMGKRPYNGRNRQEIREAIIAKQAEIRGVRVGWSQDAISFANALLERRASSRLGRQSIQQLKQHSWLRKVDWRKLKQGKIQAPFRPDENNREIEWRYQEQQISKLMLISQDMQELFAGYDYESVYYQRIKQSIKRR